MLRWLLSPPSSHQPLSPEKSCCSAGDWFSPFSLLLSPSPHLSTLSPTSGLLMLESGVETQMSQAHQSLVHSTVSLGDHVIIYFSGDTHASAEAQTEKNS